MLAQKASFLLYIAIFFHGKMIAGFKYTSDIYPLVSTVFDICFEFLIQVENISTVCEFLFHNTHNSYCVKEYRAQ